MPGPVLACHDVLFALQVGIGVISAFAGAAAEPLEIPVVPPFDINIYQSFSQQCQGIFQFTERVFDHVPAEIAPGGNEIHLVRRVEEILGSMPKINESEKYKAVQDLVCLLTFGEEVPVLQALREKNRDSKEHCKQHHGVQCVFRAEGKLNVDKQLPDCVDEKLFPAILIDELRAEMWGNSAQSSKCVLSKDKQEVDRETVSGRIIFEVLRDGFAELHRTFQRQATEHAYYISAVVVEYNSSSNEDNAAIVAVKLDELGRKQVPATLQDQWMQFNFAVDPTAEILSKLNASFSEITDYDPELDSAVEDAISKLSKETLHELQPYRDEIASRKQKSQRDRIEKNLEAGGERARWTIEAQLATMCDDKNLAGLVENLQKAREIHDFDFAKLEKAENCRKVLRIEELRAKHKDEKPSEAELSELINLGTEPKVVLSVQRRVLSEQLQELFNLPCDAGALQQRITQGEQLKMPSSDLQPYLQKVEECEFESAKETCDVLKLKVLKSSALAGVRRQSSRMLALCELREAVNGPVSRLESAIEAGRQKRHGKEDTEMKELLDVANQKLSALKDQTVTQSVCQKKFNRLLNTIEDVKCCHNFWPHLSELIEDIRSRDCPEMGSVAFQEGLVLEESIRMKHIEATSEAWGEAIQILQHHAASFKQIGSFCKEQLKKAEVIMAELRGVEDYIDDLSNFKSNSAAMDKAYHEVIKEKEAELKVKELHLQTLLGDWLREKACLTVKCHGKTFFLWWLVGALMAIVGITLLWKAWKALKVRRLCRGEDPAAVRSNQALEVDDPEEDLQEAECVSKPDLAETSGSSSGNSTETLVAVAAGTALAATGAALWRAWVTSDKEAAADAAAAKNYPSSPGCPGICVAAKEDLPAVRGLVRRDAKAVHHVNEKGLTALHVAAEHGRIAIVKFLLSEKASVEAKDKTMSITPLQVAVDNGRLKTASLLLAARASPHAKDKEGKTPLSRAKEKNPNSQMIPILEAPKGGA